MEAKKRVTVVEERIVIHRLPYMKMDPLLIRRVDRGMFVAVCLFGIQCEIITYIIHIVAAFMVSFNLFIYPGVFFYFANKERHKRGCRNYCLHDESQDVVRSTSNKSMSSRNSSEFFDRVQRGSSVPLKFECKDKTRFWNFKKKSIFGYVYALAGVLAVASLVTIQIYEALIRRNTCLFYEFNPPCHRGVVTDLSLFKSCFLIKENYNGQCG